MHRTLATRTKDLARSFSSDDDDHDVHDYDSDLQPAPLPLPVAPCSTEVLNTVRRQTW